jgi:hypothetical protein
MVTTNTGNEDSTQTESKNTPLRSAVDSAFSVKFDTKIFVNHHQNVSLKILCYSWSLIYLSQLISITILGSNATILSNLPMLVIS